MGSGNLPCGSTTTVAASRRSSCAISPLRLRQTAATGSAGCVSVRRRSAGNSPPAAGQALVRAGFRALLDAQPDIEVVGEAGDGAEAVALTSSQKPDVVLMDIRM